MSTETATTALVPQPKREIRAVQDDSQIGYMMDTAKFEHCYRIAQMMSRASLIPKHLKGDSAEQTAANCFLVVNQSIRWGFDPFAVAPETYEVGGKLGFQGKLIAAVINARAGLAEKLSYTFNDKKGDELEITVSGRFETEIEPRTVTVSVKEARTTNQIWTKDPYQKLVYTGATKWARRHKPEIVLGVITDDDADQIREELRFAQAKPAEIPQFVPQSGPKAKKEKAAVVVEPPKSPVVAPEPDPLYAETTVQVNTPTAETTKPPSSEPSFEQVVDGAPAESPELPALRAAMTQHQVTEAQVWEFSSKIGILRPGIEFSKTLADINPGKLSALTKNILANGPTLKKIRGEV